MSSTDNAMRFPLAQPDEVTTAAPEASILILENFLGETEIVINESNVLSILTKLIGTFENVINREVIDKNDLAHQEELNNKAVELMKKCLNMVKLLICPDELANTELELPEYKYIDEQTLREAILQIVTASAEDNVNLGEITKGLNILIPYIGQMVRVSTIDATVRFRGTSHLLI